MEQVIVINHGDAGGVRIVDGRITPIPPLEPGISARLRRASGLLRAAEQEDADLGERLAAVARDAAQAAIGKLSEAVGQTGGAVIVHGAGGGMFADADEGGDEQHTLAPRLVEWPGGWLVPWPPNPEEILHALSLERQRERREQRAGDGQRREGVPGTDARLG